MTFNFGEAGFPNGAPGPESEQISPMNLDRVDEDTSIGLPWRRGTWGYAVQPVRLCLGVLSITYSRIRSHNLVDKRSPWICDELAMSFIRSITGQQAPLCYQVPPS
jgi:hypothetical protein